MQKTFIVLLTAALAVSAEAYSGLVENLKNRAVTWQYEYEAGKTNTCFVLGSPSDYSANWWDHTKECVYDGYTWYWHDKEGTQVYDNQGYFGRTEDEAWAGYQLSTPMHVTKIRFWAGRDVDWTDRVGRARGVKLQGANKADFSDAVTLYTIVEDNDTLSAGPLVIDVADALQTNTFTYVRMWAPAGQECGDVAEVEFYGVETLVKPLSGRVLASEAESGHDAAMATDGDIATYYKSAAKDGYWGLDLGAVKRVSGFRFIPEVGQTWRCAGGMVQYATQPDFSDAETIMTRDWDSPTDKVAATMTFDAISARYVRFLANGRQCSLAEAEFFAPYETPAETPVLTAAATEDEAVAVKLTWNAPTNACSKIVFERATAPGGPYADVAEAAADAGAWSDPTSLGGITYYYKARFVDVDPSGTTYVGETCENRATAKGAMQLDRDATGSLRAGCTPIWYLNAYSSSSTAASLFDGNTNTYSDIVISEDGDAQAAGIDLGQPCVVTSVSVYPRKDWVSRLNNCLFWGYEGASDTTTYDWWQSDNRTELTDRIAASNETGYVWYTKAANKTSVPMQCVYLMNDWGWAFANAAELKVYGYRVADVEGVLLAPLEVTCSWKNADACLAWESCQNAMNYRLERKTRTAGSTEAWSDWTVLAEGLTATTYRDRKTTAKMDYVYRITSVKDSEAACSDDIVPPAGDRGKRGLLIFIY